MLIESLKKLFALAVFLLDIRKDRLHKDSKMKFFDKCLVFSCFHKRLLVNGKKRISAGQSLAHTLIIGKSSIGKTSSYFLPNLLLAKTQSFVITDLDGAMFKTASGYLQKKGYHIPHIVFH